MSQPSTVSSEAARGPRPELVSLIERAAGGGRAVASPIVRLRRMSLIHWRVGARRVVSKSARTAADDGAISREAAWLAAMSADTRWPESLGSWTLDGRVTSVMSEVPGAKSLLIEPPTGSRLSALGATLTDLARALGGSRPRTVPLGDALASLAGHGPSDVRGALLDEAVAAWAHNDLATEAPAHGDCTPANVLFDGDVAGLIDWSNAAHGAWPEFDRMTMAWFVWCKRDGLSYVDAAMRLAGGPVTGDAAGAALLASLGGYALSTRRAMTLAFVAVQQARAAREGAHDRAAKLTAAFAAARGSAR